MSFVIARGGAADLDAVGSLHALSRLKTYNFLDGYRPELYAAHWRARFESEHDNHRMHLATSDSGMLVGFAYVGDGWLHAIHVHPDWIGRGVGMALMRVARRSLRELGFERASLWVLADNERACRFYERDGWVQSGQSRLGEIEGVMTRQLEYVCDLRHSDNPLAV